MKAAEIEVKALFDLSHSMGGEFLAKFRYPYEALPELGAWIAAVGPQLSSDEYEKRGEQIWIHKSAKVAPSVSLTGPLIVCANAELRHCAYFRGNVLIGAGSVAGNSLTVSRRRTITMSVTRFSATTRTWARVRSRVTSSPTGRIS